MNAYVRPCKIQLGAERLNKEYPDGLPITWEFSPFTAGDNRGNARLDGEHFLQYYGVSQSLELERILRQRGNGGEWLIYSSSIRKRVTVHVGVNNDIQSLS